MAGKKSRTAAPKRPAASPKATKTTTTRSRALRTSPGNSRAGSQFEVKPSRDQIARRAYEIWLANGCPQGQEEHNWLQAETELALAK